MAIPRRINQYGATSYGNIPSAAHLDSIIQSELDAAASDEQKNRYLKLQQESEERERERLRMEEEAAKSAQTKGMVSTATQLGTTAAGLIGKDNILKAGKSIVEGAQKLVSPAVDSINTALTAGKSLADLSANISPQVTMANDGIVQGINSTVQSLAPELSSIPSAAGGEVASLAGDTLATTTGDIATDAGIDTSAAIIGEGTGTAGTSLLGTAGGIVSSMAPYAAAMGAAKLLGTGTRMLTGDDDPNNQKMDYFSRTGRIAEGAFTGLFKPLQKEIGGVPEKLKPVADLYHNIHNPAGWVLERLGCIIVTACTGRNSREVEIARQYRDSFLDRDQLSGYYRLADKIAPIIERNLNVKKNVKKWLVDRLVDYGEYRLGLKTGRPKIASYVISKAFLATIKTIGFIFPKYVRQNGEVY